MEDKLKSLEIQIVNQQDKIKKAELARDSALTELKTESQKNS